MRIRTVYGTVVGAGGLVLLGVLTLLLRTEFYFGALDRGASAGVMTPPPGGSWLVYLLLVLLGCATALLAFRVGGETVSFDGSVGLAALFLYGPMHAAWLLVAALAVRAGARRETDDPSETLRRAGTRPLMALAAGWAFAVTGGIFPLRALNLVPGWRDPEAAGWLPVLAACLTFFVVRSLVRFPARLTSPAAPAWSARTIRIKGTAHVCAASLGVVLALSFRQPGFLQAVLVTGLVLIACRAIKGMVENREDLGQRVEEMRSLNMVGRAICSTMQPEDLMAVIYRECRRLLDTSVFYVAIRDGESQSLHMELLAEGDEVLSGRDVPLGQGICGLVYGTRSPVLFGTRREMRLHPAGSCSEEVGRVQCESFLWVPIATKDRVYGVLSAQHTQARRYDADTLQAVQAIARQAAVALENIELFRKATTDSLTGLFLRTYFEQKLEEQMFKARRHGYRLSLMVIDLDNFKMINDTLGHAAGDEVLRGVGHAVGHSIRSQDVAARYGGDEFVLMLPGISVETCLEVAARIKGQVQALNFPVLARMGTSRITVSIGIATVAPGEQTDLGSLFQTADQALYEAKRTGKNRVLARSGLAS